MMIDTAPKSPHKRFKDEKDVKIGKMWLDGKSRNDIAHEIGCHENTVKNRVYQLGYNNEPYATMRRRAITQKNAKLIVQGKDLTVSASLIKHKRICHWTWTSIAAEYDVCPQQLSQRVASYYRRKGEWPFYPKQEVKSSSIDE